jgi:hypothetical protein
MMLDLKGKLGMIVKEGYGEKPESQNVGLKIGI